MLAEGVEKAALSSVSDATPCIDPLAQAHEPLGRMQAPQPRAVALGHKELGRVGAEVDGGEAHRGVVRIA
jgi:hypothetical protein